MTMSESMFKGYVYDRLDDNAKVRHTRKYISEGLAHMAAEKLAKKHYGNAPRYGVCTEWVK